jgi:hypothetical protein
MTCKQANLRSALRSMAMLSTGFGHAGRLPIVDNAPSGIGSRLTSAGKASRGKTEHFPAQGKRFRQRDTRRIRATDATIGAA